MRFVGQRTRFRLPAVLDAWEEESTELGEYHSMGDILVTCTEGSLVSDL